jgi:cytochrome c-type biogenesis protein CcmH
MIARLLVLVLAVGVWATPSYAVNPSEMLDDPALEARARELSKGLRCLVCQNQSIDDSDADLARDLRVLVRERLKAGDSDEEVIAYVVSRYGDFVLLNPPMKLKTYALWFGPALILLSGVGIIALFYRRRAAPDASNAAAEPLSDAERKRLDAIMKDDKV